MKQTLNIEQKEAFKAIQKFIDHPAADTFVLQGYAGTGKTFLMQYLAEWLDEHEYNFTMLASTGRAATVLRGKTGFETGTVHSELYKFNKVDGVSDDIPDDAPIDQYGQMNLLFTLRPPDNGKMIYIIDESSMLSSELQTDTSVATFGSGYLLTDFFEAAGKNKVIFVGDPGQLPPIGQIFSPALDMNWLAGQKRIAITTTLEKIERTDANNDILVLASMVRNMSTKTMLPTYPRLPASRMKSVIVLGNDKILFQQYLQKYKEVGATNTIAIARSNKMVQDINRAIRRDLYGSLDMPIQKNDILLVTHNNYSVPLTNGDFVVVKYLGEVRKQGNLLFQSVRVEAMASGLEYELLLSLDILYGKNINFTKEQLKSLMVEFSRRMKKKKIKANSEEFRASMMKDDFINCLRAKYGYAVTCHKAQGGEWNDVYLFLDKGMYAMKKPELFRWWYTAITRAKNQLHLAQNWWIV
ncbi:MAG: AAA family ATPase [Chitinophagaceae bacterium]